MLGEKEMTYHTSLLRSNPLRILDDWERTTVTRAFTQHVRCRNLEFDFN